MAKKILPYAVLIVVVAAVIWKFGGRLKEDYFPAADLTPSTTSQTRHIGGFEVLENCQLLDHKDNDGDSFLVKQGNNEYTFRIYFADAPEKYLSDKYKDQRKRVAEQGEYFGGLSPEQTVKIGQRAKAFTEELLTGKSFTVLTKWEGVYDSGRYYAFVLLPGSTEEQPKRLCEALVENGLARIHTKGPGKIHDYGSGTYGGGQKGGDDQESGKGFEQRLHKLEMQAKKAKAGAWGVK